MKITRKEAKPIIAATFPEYRGRRINVKFSKEISFWDTNWGGGTKNTYKALNMETSKVGAFYAPAPWINPVEGVTIELPENVLVIEHSMFCGHDLGLTIHAHPSREIMFLDGGK